MNRNAMKEESNSESTAKSKWKNEMTLNLLKIEERERKKGRGFMKRIKTDGI